jgi:hypothetical protein
VWPSSSAVKPGKSDMLVWWVCGNGLLERSKGAVNGMKQGELKSYRVAGRGRRDDHASFLVAPSLAHPRSLPPPSLIPPPPLTPSLILTPAFLCSSVPTTSSLPPSSSLFLPAYLPIPPSYLHIFATEFACLMMSFNSGLGLWEREKERNEEWGSVRCDGEKGQGRPILDSNRENRSDRK